MRDMFQVLEVFRPRQRAGPVLVGVAMSSIHTGDRLVKVSSSLPGVEVLAVEMPTEKTIRDGTVALVVASDLGGEIDVGTCLEIISGRFGYYLDSE